MTDEEDRIEELELENEHFREELDRLGDKIMDLEFEQEDYDRLHRLARDLYIAKITLSPALFERELRSFFIQTLDKRL